MRWRLLFLITAAFAVLCAGAAAATPGDVVWSRALPAQWGCSAMAATTDGGAIVLSEIIVDTGIDVILTRLDASTGSIEWKFRYNGEFRHHDHPVDMALSPDGSVVGALAMANSGAYGAFVGLDASTGALLWTREIRGRFDTTHRTTSVADLDVTATGAFVVIGTTPARGGSGDTFVTTIDPATGDAGWYRRLDVGNDQGRRIVTHADAIFASSRAKLSGNSSASFSRLDVTTGAVTWQVKRGSDLPTDLGVAPDGSILYALGAAAKALNAADGSSLWHTSDAEVPDAALEVGSDGGVYVTGMSESYDLWTERLAPADGGVMWSRTYVGSAGVRDEGRGLAVTTDGGTVFVVGSRDVRYDPVIESDMVVLAYATSDGGDAWAGVYEEPGLSVDTGAAEALVPGGDVLACGRVTSDGFGEGAASVRFGAA